MSENAVSPTGLRPAAAELEQFYESLARTPRDWMLKDGYIQRTPLRQEHRHFKVRCPLQEVDTMLRPWYDGPGQGESVWMAADNMPGHDPEIRRRLLLACGFHV